MIDRDKFISEKIKIIFIEDLDVEKIKEVLPAVDIYSNLTLVTLDNQNFHVLNSIFNMSNIISSKGGIVNNLEEENAFYTFGADFKNIQKLDENNYYNANEFYYDNKVVKFTIDNLLNESYENLPYDFKTIYDQLLMYNDSFKTFYELESLIKIRKVAEKDYLDVNKWTKNQIKNIIWANNFRLDEVINKKDETS